MPKPSSRNTDNNARTSGTLVFVVGASGVGKDTLLNGASAALSGHAKIHFVQRDITRPTESGGEQHRAVTQSEFMALHAAGAYALDWAANGLNYGLPARLLDDLAAGLVVVANGSRAAIEQARSLFSSLKIVNIVASPEIIAARLHERGRESGLELRERLERGIALSVTGPDVVVIENNANPESAIAQLVSIIETADAESKI
jgi:ribose 1,5-bisphosphokinase